MNKNVRNLCIALVIAAVACGLWLTQPVECRKASETTSPHCVD